MKWWPYLINISDQSKKCKFTENYPRNGKIPEQFYLNWCCTLIHYRKKCEKQKNDDDVHSDDISYSVSLHRYSFF